MADFDYTRVVPHPYTQSSPETHGHFLPTEIRHPAYTAAALPFRWMLKDNYLELSKQFDLGVNPEWEPKLDFKDSWVQAKQNQTKLLDCFFDHIKPKKSICLFYAKQVPLVESSARVLVGIGRVLHVGESTAYKTSDNKKLQGMLWERMVQHSIRPDFKDGFLLPYHAALSKAHADPSFDIGAFAAYAPLDRQIEFSYASEHVSNDAAISCVLEFKKSLAVAQQHFEGPWVSCLKWLDGALNELWSMRGPFPGLGAALCAIGIEHGNFVAYEIESMIKENEDPWPVVDAVFNDPTKLSTASRVHLTKSICRQWSVLSKERKALLQLISRFDISSLQAKCLYVTEEREKAGITISDREFIENPYRLFEATQLQEEPISVWTVDRGAFPSDVVRSAHPMPEPSRIDGSVDSRRVRALSIHILERAANSGNTLLPRKEVILQLRGPVIEPACEVNADLMAVCEEGFTQAIAITSLADSAPAYQLERLAKAGALIRSTVEKRLSAKRLSVKANFQVLLDKELPPLGSISADEREQEERARQEKVAALRELAESRMSVLIGPAGTGKTTLLSVLCRIDEVREGNIVLLAPTGKARVKMQRATKELGLKGMTLAQFLSPDRYKGESQAYVCSSAPKYSDAKTVIVDEASMLTEEMLAALLDHLSGVDRLILIGDHRQLPPIGSGRPFVDIVNRLAPKELSFPRVSPGFAELTVRMRQKGKVREDLQFAEWFSGANLGPGDDEIFDCVVGSGVSEHIAFHQWNDAEELFSLVVKTLASELGLKSKDDLDGFDQTLGGVLSGNYMYFNVSSAPRVEDWQILSPVRTMPYGVFGINRELHQHFRQRQLKSATEAKFRKIPKPFGVEEIVYGDKVINVKNQFRKKVYPEENAEKYVANGEMGIVCGYFWRKGMPDLRWKLEVAFSSQPGFKYDYASRDFSEEGTASLELAYALTVHKAQGSEFKKTFLIIPSPCRLLSRELLYTALTRQSEKVIVFHQGARQELKKFTSAEYSETAVRLTNLFTPARPRDVSGKFFEEHLINVTSRGELVRSKSEVIIADRLAAHGVEYTYEKPLTLGGETRFPDFTITDQDRGITFYWEHCGMLSDPDYKKRWLAKLGWYKANGVKTVEDGPGDNGYLIVTEDNAKGGISSKQIEDLIKAYLTLAGSAGA